MGISASQERYVNFYTDFAFKKLFGTEISKDELYDYRESQRISGISIVCWKRLRGKVSKKVTANVRFQRLSL